MRACVFGIGHIGAVTAACLARDGHEVLAVDPDLRKLARLERGVSPVAEPGLDALIGEACAAGRLRVARDPAAAVRASRLSLICVGTPAAADGGVALDALDAATDTIGRALREATGPHTVVLRSTVLPGTTVGRVLPRLEALSGRRRGEGLDIAYMPDLAREGQALHDHAHPPFLLVGSLGPEPVRLLCELYREVQAPMLATDPETAEALKCVANAWHALKVGFANEVGALCAGMGVDGAAVMDLFCRDSKLNLSSAYLRPGFAFGGPCLGKDLQALTGEARGRGLSLPLLESVLLANREHLARAKRRILATGRRRVGLLGLSFKQGVTDLRDSPLVALAGRLLEDGVDLLVHDRDLSRADLAGDVDAPPSGGETLSPELRSRLRPDLDEVLSVVDLVVVGKPDEGYRDALASRPEGQMVLDLAGLGVPARRPVLQALGV